MNVLDNHSVIFWFGKDKDGVTQFGLYRVHQKKTPVHFSCSAGQNTGSMGMPFLHDIWGMLENTSVKYLDWPLFCS